MLTAVGIKGLQLKPISITVLSLLGSAIDEAVSILAKYGGSLWVASPEYTFTGSDGTGAAGDGSDAGYVRDLCGNARPLTQATTGFKPKLRRVPKRLGAELVANGDFSQGATGWAVTGAGASLSVASGVGTVTNGSAEASLTLPNVSAGKTYEVVADITALSNTATVYFVPPAGSSVSNIPRSGVGQLRGVFTAAAGGCRIAVGVATAGASFSVDNISVREVLEWVWAWVFDGGDDWLGMAGAPDTPANAHTMGAAAYASAVGSRCSLLALRNTGNNTPLDALEINTGQPTWRQRNDAAATIALSGDVFPANTRLSISMRSNGTQAVLRQNGVQKSVAAVTGGAITVNNLSVGIGRGANVVDPLNGGIFAAFYCPAALSDAELLIIEKAMAQLAGVTI